MSPGYMESPYDPTAKCWYKPDGAARTIRTNTPGGVSPPPHDTIVYLPVLAYEHKAKPTKPAQPMRQTQHAKPNSSKPKAPSRPGAAHPTSTASAARARLTNTASNINNNNNNNNTAVRSSPGGTLKRRGDPHSQENTPPSSSHRPRPRPGPGPHPRAAAPKRVPGDTTGYFQQGESWYRQPPAKATHKRPSGGSSAGGGGGSKTGIAQRRSGVVRAWYASVRRRLFSTGTSARS